MKFSLLLTSLLYLTLGFGAQAKTFDLDHYENLVEWKNTTIGRMAFLKAGQAKIGAAAPVLNANIEGSIPAVYFNVKILPEKVEEFRRALDLPSELKLTPVSIVENEPAHFYVTISLSKRSGVYTGLQAEWLTYVTSGREGSNRPFFYIMNRMTSVKSMNPMTASFKKDDLTHEKVNSFINSHVAENGKVALQSKIDMLNGLQKEVKISTEWANAISYMYWPNGVRDRYFYTGSMLSASMTKLEMDSVQLFENNLWKDFLESSPSQILVSTHDVELAVMPWDNLDSDLHKVSFLKRQKLRLSKNSYFGSKSWEIADKAQKGDSSVFPLMYFKIFESPHSVYFNYRIKPEQVEAFSRHINLPKGFKLAPIKIHEDQKEPEYAITIYSYLPEGLPSKVRVEWFTYVMDELNDKPRMMFIDAAVTSFMLNPLSIFEIPSYVTHEQKDQNIDIQVGTVFKRRLKATIDLSDSETLPRLKFTKEWIESNDKNYWENGVYDKAYYGDNFTYARPVLIDAARVYLDNSTMWLKFTDPQPSMIFAVVDKLEFVMAPWFNLNEVVTSARDAQ